MDVSIICCYFNEINLLKKKLRPSIKHINNLIKPKEIILIDNKSNDGTTKFLKSLSKKKIIKIFNDKNIGKGGSIKKAIKKASAKIICVFDIDEYTIEDLKHGIEKLIQQKASLIIGNRIHDKTKFIYKKNFFGVILITKIINLLFKTKISDAAGATKIFLKKDYENFQFSSNGFDFEFELICKFARFDKKIIQYNCKYFPRSYEQGKKLKAFQDGFKILITIIKTFFTLKKNCI